jgi:hypothetical protein
VIDVYFACVKCEMWNASALSHSVLRSKSDDRHMCAQEQGQNNSITKDPVSKKSILLQEYCLIIKD